MKIKNYVIKPLAVGAAFYAGMGLANAAGAVDKGKLIKLSSNMIVRDSPSGKDTGILLEKPSTIKILGYAGKKNGYEWAKIPDQNDDNKADYIAIRRIKDGKKFGEIKKIGAMGSDEQKTEEYQSIIALEAIPSKRRALIKKLRDEFMPHLKEKGYKGKVKNIADYVLDNISEYNKQSDPDFRSGVDIVQFGVIGNELRADIKKDQAGRRSKIWVAPETYANLEQIVKKAAVKEEPKKKVKKTKAQKILESYNKDLKKIMDYVENSKFKKADKKAEKWKKKLAKYDNPEIKEALARLTGYDKVSIDSKLEVAKAKKEEVVKSTSTIPGKLSIGLVRAIGDPVDLNGISIEYGSKKAGLGVSIAAADGSSVLEQETVSGTRFNAEGKKTLADVTEIAIDGRIGPLVLGYAREISQTDILESILDQNGNVRASNKDTYVDKEGKVRAGLQAGLGKGWSVKAARDLTGDNRRTSVSLIKRLGGHRTTNK